MPGRFPNFWLALSKYSRAWFDNTTACAANADAFLDASAATDDATVEASSA
jgi:hypothetical protein